MLFWQAVIFGIVEGITEFLPISSTGHLVLAGGLLQVTSDTFFKTFEIAIQLGAILAVVILYTKKVLLNLNIFKKLIVAFIPTAIVGYVLYNFIKSWLGNPVVVLWALLLGGLFLVIFEFVYKEKPNENTLSSISYKHAGIIGLFQSLAVIPGVSRAAATIVGGLVLGYNRKIIVEFSFLLAVPTMLAAVVFDLYKNAPSFNNTELMSLAIGFIASLLVALFVIKWLLKFIQTHNFMWFGVYRVVLALAFFLFVL
jgi:undecaprenyl-diphosphatase